MQQNMFSYFPTHSHSSKFSSSLQRSFPYNIHYEHIYGEDSPLYSKGGFHSGNAKRPDSVPYEWFLVCSLTTATPLAGTSQSAGIGHFELELRTTTGLCNIFKVSWIKIIIFVQVFNKYLFIRWMNLYDLLSVCFCFYFHSWMSAEFLSNISKQQLRLTCYLLKYLNTLLYFLILKPFFYCWNRTNLNVI